MTAKTEKLLCLKLYIESRKLIQAHETNLKNLGITYVQAITLIIIHDLEECSLEEIGKIIHLNSATLSPLLKRLEQHGLIKRTRNSKDERKISISLSKSGMDVISKIENYFCAMEKNLQISKQDQDILFNLLKQLSAKEI